MILPADKGKATVIIDKEEYNSKLTSMLSDTNTYTKLKKDPTAAYKKKLVAILTRLEKEEKIKPGDKNFLYPTCTAENVPRIYGSPKIHKDGTPLRPIVDYLGSIAYNVSRSLADILGPLVGKTEHHVLNSKQLAEEMANITVEDFEIMNSHDVISLFTKTPIEQTLYA